MNVREEMLGYYREYRRATFAPAKIELYSWDYFYLWSWPYYYAWKGPYSSPYELWSNLGRWSK